MFRMWVRRRTDAIAAGALLLACATFFARRAWHGIWFGLFGDESLHFIGAQVISQGGRLYRDFIELHGPVAYALPQLYGALFGWAEPLHARIIPISVTLVAAGALARSAALRGVVERMLAPALFLGLTATVWIVQTLNMANYQPEAGMFLLTGFALFTYPAWFDVPIGAAALFLGGLCLSLACFTALSYGPAAVLFAASGGWGLIRGKRHACLMYFAAGGLAAILVMLAWLLRYADISGYFALHFVENLRDFLPYQAINKANALTILWQPIQAPSLVEAMGSAAGLIALVATFAVLGWKRCAPLLLGVAGLILTNPRGSSIFQNDAFVIMTFGFCALSLAQLPRHLGFDTRSGTRLAWIAAMAVFVMISEVTARHAVTALGNFTRDQMIRLPFESLAQSDDFWARKIRQVAAPNERILALAYSPNVYLLAGRLPMERYVYYLPWDADYAKHPVLGLTHDICADLPRDPPVVIFYNRLSVWGKYDPAKYMPCLLPILATKYRPMEGAPDYYVRADHATRVTKQ